MRSVVTLVVVAIVVASLGGMSAVALAETSATAGNSSTSEELPGERLGGVVGVQDAEFDGEITERGFGIAVAKAATNESKADVLAGQLESVEERLTELEQRKHDLDEAREAGEISHGKYTAEVAKLNAERASLERQAERSHVVASGLPAVALEDRGVDVERIEELRKNASELGGPEVAEIARSIAGPSADTEPPGLATDRDPGERGQSDQRGPPADRGPADQASESAGNDDDEADGEE